MGMNGKELNALHVALARFDGYRVKEGWSKRHGCACWTLYNRHGRVGRPCTFEPPWRNAPRYWYSIDAMHAFCTAHGLMWAFAGDTVAVSGGSGTTHLKVTDGDVALALAEAAGVVLGVWDQEKREVRAGARGAQGE